MTWSWNSRTTATRTTFEGSSRDAFGVAAGCKGVLVMQTIKLGVGLGVIPGILGVQKAIKKAELAILCTLV